MGLTEEAGKVATSTVDAMRASPLAIALLLVNISFLGFCIYVLGEVSANSTERNKMQMDLIEKLVGDVRGCRQSANPTSLTLEYPPSPLGSP